MSYIVAHPGSLIEFDFIEQARERADAFRDDRRIVIYEVRAVMQATEGRAKLFDRWANVRRDLADACAAAGCPVATPNDLRRTHANWLRDAGVDVASIADVMGHVDSRMVERVYGRLRPEQLRDRVNAAMH